MAFEDFGHLSERRKAEKRRKLQKRIAIGTVSTVVFVVLISAAVFAVVSKSGNNGTTGSSAANKSPEAAAAKPAEISHSEKIVKMICNSTDYKDKCETTLLKSSTSKSNTTISPKDFLKIAFSAAAAEADRAFDKAAALKFSSPEEKAAFEDCKTLFEDAKEELNNSISHVSDQHDAKKFTDGIPDLNNWLSAVISYQETCIDGFPDGKLKSDLQKALEAAKELTSNSLAIVSELVSFFGAFKVPANGGGSSRRLLGKEGGGGAQPPAVDGEGVPTWMNGEERRMLKANDEKPTPNVVVAKDGSGQFKTINEALAAMPQKYEGRYVIYIKQGVFEEYVTVTKKMVNVTMYGDGSQKTIVTGNKNFVDGVRTFMTATFAALGDGFMAKAIGFRNTAGSVKEQAVAVRVQSDRSIFVNCRFEGYQDTLYAQTHRQFYRSCVISGTIDFIFGDAAAIFQNCLITLRKPLEDQKNIITAQGRTDHHETTGIVLQNCRIVADKTLEPAKAVVKSYLGRPWKNFSRTIVMESEIGDLIQPAGWLEWAGDFGLKTLYYAEFDNRGAGAQINGRVKWPGYKGLISKTEAMKYTVGPFLQGDWVKESGVSVRFGLSS